jgi:poly-beta-hydroxybutyrate-responsive repressor
MDETDEQLRHPNVLVGPLLLLLLAEAPGHGYELIDRLRTAGFENRAGSLYRELRRLEDEGLVTSYWEASQTRGPARRVYELTNDGRRALRACAASAEDLHRTLSDYVERCAAVARQGHPRGRRTARAAHLPPVRT